MLETLAQAERTAFVLEVFGVPSDDIATVVGRSRSAVRQSASRGARPSATVRPDLAQQRATVTAFLAAARDGDLNGVVRVLDPDVVWRQ